MKCGVDMEYGNSISACPNTCLDEEASETCDRKNIEGCQCISGYVLSGTKCVKKRRCGCEDAFGNYRQVNR